MSYGSSMFVVLSLLIAVPEVNVGIGVEEPQAKPDVEPYIPSRSSDPCSSLTVV